MVAFAIAFLVVLFLVKNKSVFKNEAKISQNQGVTYSGNEILGDLINKDTDGDKILDWEENLWGTDPTKKETTPGVLDKDTIEKLKSQNSQNQQGLPLLEGEENLTETDKFSREFFSTIATLNQTGAMDQATVDKLSNSLAEHIQNSTQRKIYVLTDIKTTKDESKKAVQKYNDALENLTKKYPVENTVINVLQKFVIDENNVDVKALLELDPIIKKVAGIINDSFKIEIPQSLAILHLNFINSLQKLKENTVDIKLYESDPIVALSAISQYDKNTETLQADILKLSNAVEQKLNN